MPQKLVTKDDLINGIYNYLLTIEKGYYVSIKELKTKYSISDKYLMSLVKKSKKLLDCKIINIIGKTNIGFINPKYKGK